MRRSSRALPLAAAALLAAAPAAAEVPVSLGGSPASMERQHDVAVEADYTFLGTRREIDRMVAAGRLVEIPSSADVEVLRSVSYPFARPEVATFVKRLGAQYREACGERLVVTSLTRARAEQPANAHALSVHPAGMAVDFRISRNTACRDWLEGALLAMERAGILDITRERNPPHYHVALFPGPYAEYAGRQLAAETEAAAAKPASIPPPEAVLTARRAPGVPAPEGPPPPWPVAMAAPLLVAAGAILEKRRR